jgi:hypothetical protein
MQGGGPITPSRNYNDAVDGGNVNVPVCRWVKDPEKVNVRKAVHKKDQWCDGKMGIDDAGCHPITNGRECVNKKNFFSFHMCNWKDRWRWQLEDFTNKKDVTENFSGRKTTSGVQCKKNTDISDKTYLNKFDMETRLINPLTRYDISSKESPLLTEELGPPPNTDSKVGSSNNSLSEFNFYNFIKRYMVRISDKYINEYFPDINSNTQKKKG